MGHIRIGFDVVVVGRAAPQTGLSREGRSRAGLAALAFDRGDQGGLFTAHEGSGAHADFEVKGKTRAEDVLPQQAELARLADGDVQGADGDRVFGSAVDVAAAGADRVSRDDHAFENGMRIAFQDPAVHEGSRIALIRVAGDVFRAALGGPAELPFFRGGKARPAAPAKPRAAHPVDHLFRGHLGQGLAERLVAVLGDVVFDILGVDLPAVAQDNPDLFGFGGAQFFIDRRRRRGQELFRHPAFQEVLLNQIGDIIHREVGVMNTFRVDHHLRPFGAPTQAGCLQNLNLVDETLVDQFILKRVDDLVRAF